MGQPPNFHAYIDESGDVGFLFPKSSEWFVISAAIMQSSDQRFVLAETQRILTAIGWKAGNMLHFGKLDHERRVFMSTEIAKLPVTCTSVLVHKPSLSQSFGLRSWGTGRLYKYATRFLLERVSAFSRDNCPSSNLCTTHLIFDKRTHGSHVELRAYIELLRDKLNVSTIHWPAIDTTLIEARSPADALCLHIPDALAGGFRAALEVSSFGYTEHRFAKIFRPIVYTRFGQYHGYGLKFFPSRPNGLHWIDKYY